MSFPLLLMALPLIMAVLTYNLRRWLWSQIVLAVCTALVLITLVNLVPLEQPLVFAGRDVIMRSSWEILGRSFTFEVSDRPLLGFALLAALTFFLAAGVARSDALFVPVALGSLTLLEATVFVKPFVYAALFLELTAGLAVFMLVDRSRPRTQGAMRYLVCVSLGVPFILLAGWQLEVYQINPDDPIPLFQATWMLAVGFLIMLAVAPFHSWVALIGRYSPPLAASFVLTVIQSVVVLFMMDMLVQFDWLRANPQFFLALRLGGMAMVVVGGTFVLSQRSLGGLIGYSLLIDWGATLVALGLGTADGAAVAGTLIVARALALVVWSVGAVALGEHYRHPDGCVLSYPFATIAVLVGGLSLSALPLMAGFPGRWALLSLLYAVHPGLAIGLLVAGVSAWLGYARVLQVVLGLREGVNQRNLFSGAEETPATICFITLGVSIILGVGLAPQFFSFVTRHMVANLAQLLG